MKDLQENNVPALNQNPSHVYIHETPNSRLRVLFVGNSITKHAPRPQIGWYRDCGMAASCLENDYVHLVVKKLQAYDPNVSFAIAQVAQYERTFFEKLACDDYQSAADFGADVVIFFYGANVSKDYDTMENPPRTFEDAYEDMRNLVTRNGQARAFHAMGFYIRPQLEKEKLAVAHKYNDPYIDIDDIRMREDTHGEFNHPSDLGMQLIADRFGDAIVPAVQDILKSRTK